MEGKTHPVVGNSTLREIKGANTDVYKRQHLNRANFSVQRRADGSVNETTSSLSMRFSSGGIVIDGRAGTLEVRKFPLITFDISALGKISEIKWDWGDCCTLNKIVGYK